MIVADTSVLIKLIVPEPRSDLARRLRGEDIAAPALWIAEIANVLWRKVQTKEISDSQASSLLRILMSGAIRTLAMEDMAQSALAMAHALGHPVYDCFFLEAAIRENTYIVTDDARFAGAVRRHKKWNGNLRLLTEI